jgi:UDPglucose 6-dehydrogenase
MSNIAVIGAGYVGLVTGACFAELGNKVNMIEIDTRKVSALERGEMPIDEPGLPELWQRNQKKGRLQITNHYIEGLLGVKFAFIAVGTPSSSNGEPNLRWVRMATKNIAEAASGPLTVVAKSTVPVGTAEKIADILTKYGQNGNKFAIVSNPEFLREGTAVFDFMNPSRVVVGSTDFNAANDVARLYQPLNSPIVICDNRTAELSKYAANVFLATRISFINEIALLCDEYGVDVVKVAEIIGLDPRFGKSYLNAGLGWGGSCLPKDVKGLIHMAKDRKVPIRLLKAVEQVNQQQTQVIVRKLQRQLGLLKGKTIGILGLAFKPDSYDIREARSLSVVSLLEEQGCHIKAYDPVAMEAAARLLPKVVLCKNAYEVAEGCDALILVTEWEAFRQLDMTLIRTLMKQPVIIDGRNFFKGEELEKAGFLYDGIGRGSLKKGKTERITLNNRQKVINTVVDGELVVSEDSI